MDWVLVHAGHLLPLVGLGGWLGWAHLARSRAGRSRHSGPAPAAAHATAAPGTVTASWGGAPVSVSLDARLLLMACSVGAAVVHADVITSHFQVSALYGWFFVLSALTQLAWGLLVVRQPDRALLATGAVGNGLIVVLWLATRTTGLPIGPTPWQAESVGGFDVLATVLELALVVGSVVLLAGTTGARRSLPKYDSRQTSPMLANLHARPASTQNSAGRIGGLRRNGDERHAALAGADRGRRGGRPSASGGARPTGVAEAAFVPPVDTPHPPPVVIRVRRGAAPHRRDHRAGAGPAAAVPDRRALHPKDAPELAVRHRWPGPLLGGAGRIVTGLDRGALPFLHHDRVHRAVPGLAAVPLEHRLHGHQPWRRLRVEPEPDLQSQAR